MMIHPGIAKEKGFHRIELNMWEFNQDALAFYEAAGFQTIQGGIWRCLSRRAEKGAVISDDDPGSLILRKDGGDMR